MRKENNKEENKDGNKGSKKAVDLKKIMMWFGFIVIMGLILASKLRDITPTETDMTYKEFTNKLYEGKFESAVVYKSTDYFTVEDKEGNTYKIPNPQYDEFKKDLMSSGLKVITQTSTLSNTVESFITSIPVYMLMFLVGLYLIKMTNTMAEGVFKGIKKSKTTTFDKVAGLSEVKEEVAFAIDILKNKDMLKDSGGRGVKGLLFYGPPGTGKTLMARAIAGEAGVPFIAVTGSDFTSMFAGVGVQKVKSLFDMARVNAPCVVFIDEIDSIGKKRKYESDVSADSSSTLNILLQKLDGIGNSDGILFIAATNMLDKLDSALTRPGRFDRQIYIGSPTNKKDRDAIISIHLSNKKLKEGLSLNSISKYFVGLTGAQIEGVLNEAVLESIRLKEKGIISEKNIDSALMKMITKGILKKRYNEDENKLVAFHESGHTIVSLSLGRKISKVTILPYGETGGSTMRNLDEDIEISSIKKKSELLDEIRILYGGLVCEEIIYGEHSSGCSDDIKKATNIIDIMIDKLGMMGSLIVVNEENPFVADRNRTKKDELSNSIKKEVEEILKQNIDRVKILSEKLLAEETIYNLESLEEIK